MAGGEHARSVGCGRCSGARRTRRSAGADTSKDGELILAGSTNTTQISHTEKTTTAGVYQEMSGQGETKQTLNQTQIKGKVNIANGINTTVVIPEGDLKTQVLQLSQQPGMAYIGELAKDPKVNWQQVKLAYDKWDYSQAGLTPAGAALLAIAIAAYTGGMGAELLGGTAATSTSAATLMGSTVYGAAANAGFAALASSAGVSFVNNGGDIGKTLKDMGSSQNVKGVLTAMVTAGVLTELGSTTTATGQTGANAQAISTTQAVDKFAANLMQNVTNNMASAVVSSAINGTPLNEDTLSTALSSALITAGMAQAANNIGAATQNGTLNAYTQAMAHALAGCVGGAATTGNSGGCSAGAVGAVVGELSAGYAKSTGATDANALAFARSMSAVAGALVGGPDGAAAVNVAAQMGANAAANNRLLHQNEKERLATLAKATGLSEEKLTRAACYEVKCWAQYPEGSKERDAAYVSVAETFGLSKELNVIRSTSASTGLFNYSTFDQFKDATQATALPLGVNGAKTVFGGLTVATGSTICGASGVGCVVGGPLAVIGASEATEGVTGLYRQYQGQGAAGFNPVRSGLNAATPVWGDAIYDGTYLGLSVLAMGAPVLLKVGASDGINRANSMFGVTVPRWQNPTINPLTNDVLLSPTAAKGLLLYGVGAKVPAVVGDVNNAGGGK